jgi:pyruvate ferredoxin oxidoreductase delta subunit
MSKATEKKEQKAAPGWKDLTIAGVIPEPGTARNYKTGGWRSEHPVFSSEKCISCLRCWMYCPEGAVIVKEGKIVGIDLDYCKGCGICAKVCPAKEKAIQMEREEA